MGVAWSTNDLIAWSASIRSQDASPSDGPIVLRCPGNGRRAPIWERLIKLQRDLMHDVGPEVLLNVRAVLSCSCVAAGLSSVPICQIGRKRSARLSSAWTGWTWGPCDRAGTSIRINGTDLSAQTVCASVGSCARRTTTFQKVASCDVSDLPIAP